MNDKQYIVICTPSAFVSVWTNKTLIMDQAVYKGINCMINYVYQYLFNQKFLAQSWG
jgi:hypothetical protein